MTVDYDDDWEKKKYIKTIFLFFWFLYSSSTY